MLLGRHPDVMRRLREEHDRAFDQDLATTLNMISQFPTNVKELGYTTAVLKETLRLFPVGFSVRVAPDNMQVTGAIFCFHHLTDQCRTEFSYKGKPYDVFDQMIIQLSQASHYDPEQFSDPNTFLPARFLDSRSRRDIASLGDLSNAGHVLA
jgi:cytochrome P450